MNREFPESEQRKLVDLSPQPGVGKPPIGTHSLGLAWNVETDPGLSIRSCFAVCGGAQNTDAQINYAQIQASKENIGKKNRKPRNRTPKSQF